MGSFAAAAGPAASWAGWNSRLGASASCAPPPGLPRGECRADAFEVAPLSLGLGRSLLRDFALPPFGLDACSSLGRSSLAAADVDLPLPVAVPGFVHNLLRSFRPSATTLLPPVVVSMASLLCASPGLPAIRRPPRSLLSARFSSSKLMRDPPLAWEAWPSPLRSWASCLAFGVEERGFVLVARPRGVLSRFRPTIYESASLTGNLAVFLAFL